MTDSQKKRKSKASRPAFQAALCKPLCSSERLNFNLLPVSNKISSGLFFFCSFQPALPFDVLTDRFWVWMQLCISTIEISQFKLHSKTPFACDHLKTHLSFWLMVSLKHVLKGSLADTLASVSICPCTYLLFKQVSHLALVCCQPGRFLSSQRHETSAICF